MGPPATEPMAKGGGGRGTGLCLTEVSGIKLQKGPWEEDQHERSIAEASGWAQPEVRTHIREVSLGATRKQGDLLGLHG